MRSLIFCLMLMLSGSLFAQGTKILESEPKVIYKYKKYQKFDFEDLVIEGETGSPGDLSIAPRYQRKFKNKLPYRKNFNAEMRRSVERIR
ncbi:MAG: hypothetical protein CME63_10450 [Halobacteriovoraceae bacterium]|nr:hypothetical protein [Halobacteriovoraceae bacterium]|tara:strand:+ start:59261 stop:59530 length:270 start_codon:yes stop_codon:yes gene_type:complete